MQYNLSESITLSHQKISLRKKLEIILSIRQLKIYKCFLALIHRFQKLILRLFKIERSLQRLYLISSNFGFYKTIW